MSSDLAEHVYTFPDYISRCACIPIFGESQEAILFTLEKSILFISIVGAGVTTLIGPDAYLAEQLLNNVHVDTHAIPISDFVYEDSYKNLDEKEKEYIRPIHEPYTPIHEAEPYIRPIHRAEPYTPIHGAEHIYTYTIPDFFPTCIPVLGESQLQSQFQKSILFTLEKFRLYVRLGPGATL